MDSTEQQSLKALDDKLWKAADKLRANLDAANYYLPREDYDSEADYQQPLNEELEILDYYREANVFWVPKPARWKGGLKAPFNRVALGT